MKCERSNSTASKSSAPNWRSLSQEEGNDAPLHPLKSQWIALPGSVLIWFRALVAMFLLACLVVCSRAVLSEIWCANVLPIRSSNAFIRKATDEAKAGIVAFL
jgi:hypothetical protein